jgi:hypothetical protein
LTPSTFGIKSAESGQNGKLLLKMEICVPGFRAAPAKGSSSGTASAQAPVDLQSCERGAALAEMSLMDIREMEAQRLFTGVRKAEDQDDFGILARVESSYVDGTSTKQLSSLAVVRRPRPMVRIETKEAVCSPTCQVSVSSRSQHFCLSTPRIVNKGASSMAKVSFVVHNDGPGHLYRFKINRSFVPNPAFNAQQASVAPVEVVNSENPAFPDINGLSVADSVGIPPGGSKEFFDESLPCYDDAVFVREVFHHTTSSISHVHANVRNHAFDGGALWSQSVSRSQTSSTAVRPSSASPRPSGTANYSFVAGSVEPKNALSIVGGSRGVAGSMTTTTETVNVFTHVHSVILFNTGMN